MTNGKAGLEGTTAARTAISDVDGDQGRLIYQSIDIFELAGSSTFEETTYLIRNGKLPDVEQPGVLDRQLAENRHPPQEIVALIGSLPNDAAPMDVLRTAIFAMSCMSGWTANVLEQQSDNRLIGPRAEYTGPRDATYVPLEDHS